jgi:uncharacterized membrane protein
MKKSHITILVALIVIIGAVAVGFALRKGNTAEEAQL